MTLPNTIVIGLGSIGQRHARVLREIGHTVATTSRRGGGDHVSIADAVRNTHPGYAVIATETSGHADALAGRLCGVSLRSKPIPFGSLQKGRAYIRRMGAKGVILGRWTAALRALVPGLAGMSRMHYPRFLIANIIGGTGWATLVAVVGYLAGNSYKKVESALGSVSYVLLGLIVVGFVAWHIVRKRREKAAAE